MHVQVFLLLCASLDDTDADQEVLERVLSCCLDQLDLQHQVSGRGASPGIWSCAGGDQGETIERYSAVVTFSRVPRSLA